MSRAGLKSILVPSYNDGGKLEACLRALALQREAGEMEAVVVYDGSTDGSPQRITRLLEQGELGGLSVIHEALPQNRGRSAARNRAFELARGEWIVYLDADLQPRPDWLAQLSRGLGNKRHVHVGSMRYRVQDEKGRDLPLARYQLYLQGRGPARREAGEELPPRHFYTCNSMLHRDLLEAAGPFDEQLKVWGGEDIDMGLRLAQAGGTLYYRPQALAWHGQERSFQAHCANLELFGREVLPRLVQRHPELYEALALGRREKGVQGVLIGLLGRFGGRRALLAWEGAGLYFNEGLYNLCVFLHYSGGYVAGKRSMPKA